MPKTAEKPVTTENGWAYGYRPKPSTRTVKAELDRFSKAAGITELLEKMSSDTGVVFEAEITSELTISAQEKLTLNKPWPEVYKDLAPFVIGWNAGADDTPGGEFEALPAPASAGWEVFKRLRTDVALFLYFCLKFNLGGELPKERSSTGDTVDGADAVT
jgi:hypothetical protein